jgi:uncharacterized FAD-dependent dehydrogenase
MIRINEIKLPLDHPPEALRTAVLKRLQALDTELLSFVVVRRGVDARRRNGIMLVYSVDVVVSDEAAVLRRCAADRHVAVAPELRFAPLARPPAGAPRPRRDIGRL